MTAKFISKIVLYLVIPCVIINAFQVDYTSEKVKELLLVFAASVLLQVILLAAVWGVGKVLKLNEVEMTSIYYSNSGNFDRTAGDFLFWEKNGYYRLCVHECPIGISVDAWQEYDQPGRKVGLEKDCIQYQYDLGICRSCAVFYQDQASGNCKSDLKFCGQYDRSGKYDRNGGC